MSSKNRSYRVALGNKPFADAEPQDDGSTVSFGHLDILSDWESALDLVSRPVARVVVAARKDEDGKLIGLTLGAGPTADLGFSGGETHFDGPVALGLLRLFRALERTLSERDNPDRQGFSVRVEADSD